MKNMQRRKSSCRGDFAAADILTERASHGKKWGARCHRVGKIDSIPRCMSFSSLSHTFFTPKQIGIESLVQEMGSRSNWCSSRHKNFRYIFFLNPLNSPLTTILIWYRLIRKRSSFFGRFYKTSPGMSLNQFLIVFIANRTTYYRILMQNNTKGEIDKSELEQKCRTTELNRA